MGAARSRRRSAAGGPRAALLRPPARNLELGQRSAVLAHEDHVHRLPAAAFFDEVLLRRRKDLALRAAGLERLEEAPEALRVDPDAVADGGELVVALDGPCMVE